MTQKPNKNPYEMIVKTLPVNRIRLGKNSRLTIRDEDLSGLMESIKSTGLLQPIGVSKAGKGYSICYGNRRFIACTKLGMKKIPAVIVVNKNSTEEDLKNLTENIQRRQISLMEAGRYVDILMKGGLSRKEIAVRLGTSPAYVSHTIDAYKMVPKKFQKDIEVGLTKTRGGSTKNSGGKISVSSARKILNAKKQFRLTRNQMNYLFEEAKKNNGFVPEKIGTYAVELKSGKTDPVKTQTKVKRVHMNFMMPEREYDRLYVKYIVDGPFNGMSTLFAAIICGKISERVKTIGTY